MDRRSWIVVLLLGTFFVGSGALFIHRLGVQPDEVFFGAGLWPPLAVRYSYRIFHWRVPLMLLNYLGATKTWFYAIWFAGWAPSLESLRIPMLLAGAGTLVLTAALLFRMGGRRPAILGVALLATDPVYLLVCLWGPAIVHHLLLPAILLAFVRGSYRLAFFCIGLALWDKALFLWALAGIAVAALAVFPRQVRARISWSIIRTAALWTVLGALPLVLFNVKFRGETLRANTSFTLDEVRAKAEVLRLSLDGGLLFGWIVAEDQPASAGVPRNFFESMALRVSDAVGRRESGLMLWALAASVLLWPWLRSKAVLFALIVMAVAWAQMAVTRGAGSGAHHATLLWPLPSLVVALTMCDLSERLPRFAWAATAVAGAVLCLGNILVVNQYLADAVRNGPGLNFSNAVEPLSAFLDQTPARVVVCVDWGIFESLRFQNQGRLPLRLGADLFAKDALSPEEAARVREWIRHPDALFVGRTPGREFFPGAGLRLRRFAADGGLAAETLATLTDSHGRPTMEVLRFRAAGPGPTSQGGT